MANSKRYGENSPRAQGRGRNSATGAGPSLRVNPTGARHNGNGPDAFHAAINDMAVGAGMAGQVGNAIGRGIGSVGKGIGDVLGAPGRFIASRQSQNGGQITNAMSTYGALGKVMGKKRP